MIIISRPLVPSHTNHPQAQLLHVHYGFWERFSLWNIYVGWMFLRENYNYSLQTILNIIFCFYYYFNLVSKLIWTMHVNIYPVLFPSNKFHHMWCTVEGKIMYFSPNASSPTLKSLLGSSFCKTLALLGTIWT